MSRKTALAKKSGRYVGPCWKMKGENGARTQERGILSGPQSKVHIILHVQVVLRVKLQIFRVGFFNPNDLEHVKDSR
jgi:hypothetical protein